MASGKPLDGIDVLTFELQVAGPYCTMMLADQGASVIKVERPEGGDTARGGAPKVKNDKGETQSGYFLRFNRNKRSVTLNLKNERARQIFRNLAKQSDVVVENFRPGLLDELGLAERSRTAFSRTGHVLERGREPYMAPWGPFECKDGYVGLIVATEGDWAKFSQAIGRPDLVGHEGATSGPERAKNMSGWLGDI